jgi:hypothetical protein
MLGRLYKTETNKWFINSENKVIPLHPEIIIDGKYEDGTEVEFMIVDEFTHPDLFHTISWGDGITCAWIITNEENPKPNKNFLKRLFSLEKENPNDMDLGRQIRKLLNKIK